MKKLTLQEQHSILLEIAKEFDRICTENNIPYYMLGGTMLGAIRHKGFIPWDDDMDFGVPYEYFEKLKNAMEAQLPSYYKFCTYENCTSINVPFVKIADNRTILDDKQIPLPLEEKIGVNIDVFPLYNCKDYSKRVKIIALLGKLAGKIYTNSRSKDGMTLVIKRILRVFFPFSVNKIIKIRLQLAATLPQGKYMANIFGRWKKKECCPYEWYGENIRYSFNGVLLCGIKEYDSYLRQMYGSYMQLPSVDKQFVHSENAYLKE